MNMLRFIRNYRVAVVFLAITVLSVVVLSLAILSPLGPSLLEGTVGGLWPRVGLGCALLVLSAVFQRTQQRD